MKDATDHPTHPGYESMEAGASLSVQDISWSVRRTGQPLLHPISFSLAPGRVLGVVGPNGSGKTTFLRLLYRYHRPVTGTVSIDGQDIWRQPARAVARKVAAVLQEQPTDFALTVRDIVTLGRTPHCRGFAGRIGASDTAIVDAALDRLDLRGMVDRHLGTVSGGERQRVMVARALAQEPRLLILDEPTNHLDIRHQLEVIDLIRDLPLTIVTSLHDLNMATAVCDDVLLLKAGRPLGFGPPSRVLSAGSLANAFDVIARRERLAPSETDHLTFHLSNEGTPHENAPPLRHGHPLEHGGRLSRDDSAELQPNGEFRRTAGAGRL